MRETVHDIRWMSVLHRPKWNEDTNRSSPAGLLHIYIGSNPFLIERETVHDIRWMSVLHRPEQSGDLERSSLAESFIARDGVLEVHWTSVSTDRSGTKIRTVRVRQDSFIYKRYPFRIPFVYKKSARRDSNPRPRPWQGRAPPTEPLAHNK